jgi:hypothetical protein
VREVVDMLLASGKMAGVVPLGEHETR